MNPRLVKEADALTDDGYKVTVLYAYWNDWGTQLDKQLLSGKKWKATRLGGDPQQKPVTYFLSRLIHKISYIVLQKTGNYKYFADLAIARSSYFLMRGARKYKADLYIAHNLGALPAAFKTSLKYKKPCGFDAEDFHRQESTDDVNSFNFKIAKYIEDKCLPSIQYLTASSPFISERYASLYNKKVTTILNVFPKTDLSVLGNKNINKPLKLFWFSQTIGPNRGLEMVIEAMGLAKKDIELHLLGQPVNGFKQHLLQMANDEGLNNSDFFFYEPIKADEIFHLAAQFDIGLASDVNFCLNRNIALTNKIFTYIQSGLAVVANNTPAQSSLMHQYSKTGKVYNNAIELSAILNEYTENRELLYQTQKESFEIGQNQLNWENESKKFLMVIKEIIK
ncbi:MAG: hypothetical protein JWQ63_1441 [Mucilaginibacter sp.]|nr:hypothetical protein [Mucilaginibacter sp.]